MPGGPAFRAGFRAVLPLWIGIVPFGAAYAVSARAAGIGPFETQLMSLLVFAGGAQFAAVGLVAAGAGPWTLVSTTLLINLRHVLYGVVVGATTPLDGRRRWLAAHLLTDEVFGVHIAQGRGQASFLIGAGVSLYLVWNLATLAGTLLAHAMPDPGAIGLDIVFPLAFLALLVPLLRDWPALFVAVSAALGTWAASHVLGPSLALTVVAPLAAALGAVLSRPTERGA